MSDEKRLTVVWNCETFEVVGEMIEAQHGGWEDESWPAYFAVHEVFYHGVDVSSLLQTMSAVYLDELSELCTKQLAGGQEP